MMARRCLGAFCVCLVFCIFSQLHAQSRQLSAELESLYPATRTSAPSTVLWKLSWQGVGLVEGQLELSFYTDEFTKESFTQVKIPDLVLNSGDNHIKVNLPVLNTWGYNVLLSVHARFITENKTYDLGKHPLRISNQNRRSLAMCICRQEQRIASPTEDALLTSLHMEEFNPAKNDASILTINTLVRPEDMPINPLNYCSFDLVVLMDEEWIQMRSRQLKALKEWVQAGGSLLIIPNPQTSAEQVKFLNALASSQDKSGNFYLNASGNLTTDSPPKDGLWLLKSGWGRAVIATHRLTSTSLDIESPHWRKAIVFLWKFRQEQYAPCMAMKKWDDRIAFGASNFATQQEYGFTRQHQHQPITESGGLLSRLMPKDVRMFPLSLMAILLFCFVLAIGPGDYYLLGILRRRRLTWIVFPLVTIGFSMFIAWLIESYMGGHQEPNTLIVMDIGEDGQVVRENRFELNFAGRYQNLDTQVRSGLLTPLSNHLFSVPGYFNQFNAMQQRQFMNYQEGQTFQSSQAPIYQGRFPSQFSVKQGLPQWTPQVNRIFRITPKTEALKIPWDRFSPHRYQTDEEMKDLRNRYRDIFGPNATVQVFHRQSSQTLLGKPDLFPNNSESPFYASTKAIRRDFLKQICVRKQNGFFTLVSQISPTGGANFEDLTILDPSDPQQWLLVVAIEKENELLIYRKLYNGDE